jgi:hypothetical protein
MTVDLHRCPEVGGTGKQPSERAIAEELVSGADEPLSRIGQVEERPCVAEGQCKGLLDIDVRASVERRGCGLEMRSRGRADVNDVRLRVSEQGLDSWKRSTARECSELLRPARHPVVHADHDGGNREPLQHAQVMAGHLARANEGDAKHHCTRYFRTCGPTRRVNDNGRWRHNPTRPVAVRPLFPVGSRSRHPIGIVYQNNGLSCAPH